MISDQSAGQRDDAVQQMIDTVAVGCRILGAEGHSDLVWGHAAGRDPLGRGVWMKANDRGFEEVDEEGVILVDREGNVLEGIGGRHVEYPIHTELMAARPDIGGVAHTHSEHAVALASAGQTLLPLSHAANLFVPPEVPRFTLTGDLITSPELGQALADSLGKHNAVFLVNHGIVTVGKDVESAVVRAVILERACRMQLLVKSFGGWPTWSDPEESLSKRNNIYPHAHLHQVWRYLRRQLGPGGASGWISDRSLSDRESR